MFRRWCPSAAHPHLATVLMLTVALCTACKDGTGPGDGGDNNGGGTPDTTTPVVTVSIATDQDRAEISPYIYGSNQDAAGGVGTIRRYGGNRTTGYNWENNFSNAGSDWQHSSDTFALWYAGLPDADSSSPGIALSNFHERSLATGAASIITVPVAGYVSADAKGTVLQSETAPSPRWVKVVPKKGAPFSLTPDRTDGTVYVDEEVNFFVNRYGPAGSTRGIGFYSLDNEPCLWSATHARIHPDKTGARELVDKSIATASAIKAVDPQAQILGPALYGFVAYMSCQDAPDWNQVKGGYGWFIDYYLAQMRLAGNSAGKRLLDVLDVHWYPEATGDHRITDGSANTVKDQDERMQAARSLYDPSYVENSWIGQWFRAYLPILPRLQASIIQYYPGTKLAITEYDFGAGYDFSGGVVQADLLGAFGRYGVYIATMWGISDEKKYFISAFNLYRNYDGKGGKYGSTAVSASSSDLAKAAAYASVDAQNALHIILVNRTRGSAMPVRFTITSPTGYTSATTWGYDATSPTIRQLASVSKITGNAFTYTVPATSAVHLVLK